MTNPLIVAAKGKGLLPMLERGQVIASRYGFSPAKIAHAMNVLLDTVTHYGSSATIPATTSALASNPAAARRYADQGMEMAVHGLHHLDYSLFSLEHQVEHLQQAQAIFQKLGIPVSGFRCPYLRWNQDTLTALKETGFRYDSSQALAIDILGKQSTDSYRRALDFYRAQTAECTPALPGWSDQLIRIPYCLPDDEALVERLHLTDENAMADIWLRMLDWAYEQGELLTLGLHPERAIICKAALEAVLAKARTLSPSVWITRLDEVATWYRALDTVTFEIQEPDQNTYHVKITAPDRAAVMARSVEVMGPTQPWIEGYSRVLSSEFTLRSGKRPWIGLATDTPLSLQRFLRSQGYLIEVSPDHRAYGIYLDQRSLHAEDERLLLAALEREPLPLVRLARWPEAARCGLVITGDLDAFTIWDYANRILAR